MTINEIINRYHQDCFNFAVHLSGNYHMGQDLVQDAMVKLIERSDTFDCSNGVKVKAWLFRTIKNKFIDDYRRMQKQLQQIAEETHPDFQEESVLKMLLGGLTKIEYQMISMRYLEGYTSQEIAERLSMNASTLRNHLSKALSKLKREYEV